MKFDKSQDSSWNALVVYVNSQCILAGSKPQKKFFVLHFVLLQYSRSLLKVVMDEVQLEV